MGEVINVTHEQLTAAFNAWWDDYQLDPSSSVDYDADDYDDTNYASDSVNTLIKYINKVKG